MNCNHQQGTQAWASIATDEAKGLAAGDQPAPSVELPVHFNSALTNQQWFRQINIFLDDPRAPDAGLVGVDIAHVDLPGTILSEVCIGFFLRGGQIDAKVSGLRDDEAENLDVIMELVDEDSVASRLAHQALCDRWPQINSLMFRSFTLVYIFDKAHADDQHASVISPRLVLHDEARAMDPEVLSKLIQDGLDGFMRAHECGADLCLLAPTPRELRVACAQS